MPKGPNLSAQEIYEKEFGIDVKGYSASAVDDFLDLVIEDYQFFEDQLNYYADLVERYENRLNEMSLQNTVLRPAPTAPAPSPISSALEQKEILERLAKLEEAVFRTEDEEDSDLEPDEEAISESVVMEGVPQGNK